MAEAGRMERLRTRLLKRREALFEAHQRSEEARRVLQAREVEYEETAQKETLADIAASVDEQETKEIEALDAALTRLDAGEYPICESCRRHISFRRLKAMPWTKLCARCARRAEQQASAGTAPEEEEGEETPSRPASFPDPDEIEAIFDELKEDGGIDTQELRIALHDDGVHLEGFLPSEVEHQKLLDVIEDHIGLQDIVDELLISPLSWERGDRAPDGKTEEDIAEELAPQSADGEGGLPVEPADALNPEEK